MEKSTPVALSSEVTEEPERSSLEVLINTIYLIETSIVLLVFSFFLGKTYYKVGFKNLGFQEHCALWIFFMA